MLKRLFIFSTLITRVVLAQEPDCNPYSLHDFMYPCKELDEKAIEIMRYMSDDELVGQMIMPAAGKFGKSKYYVTQLVKKKQCGGILLLTGTREEFKSYTEWFDSIAVSRRGASLLFSADAELSLINMKIRGTTPVKYANKINSTQELKQETQKICDELNYMGIHQNFAPVADLSPNATVSMRSFGNNKDTVIRYCNKFVEYSSDNQILSCAKHFPGHGNVVGDTHKQTVFIDGDLTEVDNYKPLIKNSVPSIMVGHIAIRNNETYNTDGLPATCSRKIVTDLLKTEMGFKGLVITDALNMGGVVDVPNCGLKAAQAGCDILLMPVDEKGTIDSIVAEMKKDPDFKAQILQSVKKIIRLKICMGIIQ